MMEKVTIDAVAELVDSPFSEPTLVRDADGTLAVVHGALVRGRVVVATWQDYMDYCGGKDDEWQRASFVEDTNTYGK